MNVWPILPVVIPLITAALCLAAWRSLPFQRAISVAGAVALLAAAIALLVHVTSHGVAAVHVGGWTAPFGITMVADTLGALMVVLAALLGLAVVVYSLVDVDADRQQFGYFPLVHVLLMGVCGAFLTGDVFNLFVWFEVMLVASFILLVLGGEPRQMRGGLTYVTLNLISSALFLSAVGIIYGVAHTLNMADLALVLPEIAERAPHLLMAVAALLLISFGIKAGLFPLFSWLPASYHTPPSAVSALFAGLLTKVGVYALIRMFAMVIPSPDMTYVLIACVAAATMVIGVFGAVVQRGMRRILSFHIISQIGYIAVGVGLLASDDPTVRVLGLTAAVFYTAHHMIVKTTLFLVAGVIQKVRGTTALDRLGGLVSDRRLGVALTVVFAIPALSLAGVPPLSGFWAKLAVIQAALTAEQYAIVACALGAGLLTIISMVKIWNAAFWRPAPRDDRAATATLSRAQLACMLSPAVVLAALTVAIGLMPQPLFVIAEQAAHQLLDPSEYIRAVGLAVDISVTMISHGGGA